MKPFRMRRIGAALLLAAFLPSCTDGVPTSPETPTMIPEGPAETRLAKTTDGKGREHDVQIESRGGYITRVTHDVDGEPFARLAYHYRAEPDGTYSLARVTGNVHWAGRKVDVGAIWPQIQALGEARGVLPSLLPAGPGASAAPAGNCYWELAELAAWSAGMAGILAMSPVMWPEFFFALAGYTHALKGYKACVSSF